MPSREEEFRFYYPFSGYADALEALHLYIRETYPGEVKVTRVHAEQYTGRRLRPTRKAEGFIMDATVTVPTDA